MTTVKAAVRERDNHCCIKCGMTNDSHLKTYGKSLEVHRTTPGSIYTLEGCVTLCVPCHAPEPRRKRGTPDLARPGLLITVIDGELRHAVDDYIADHNETHDHRATLTSTLEAALKKYLAAEGHWPRKPRSDT